MTKRIKRDPIDIVHNGKVVRTVSGHDTICTYHACADQLRAHYTDTGAAVLDVRFDNGATCRVTYASMDALRRKVAGAYWAAGARLVVYSSASRFTRPPARTETLRTHQFWGNGAAHMAVA